MTRRAAFVVAALTGVLLAGCAGMFGQSGVSLPRPGDGEQTVSDVADSLIAHQPSASDNAREAIVVTDALGSVVREMSSDESFLYFTYAASRGAAESLRNGFARTSGRPSLPGPRSVFSVEQLVLRANAGNVSPYCQSSAGYMTKGIPSLDETFGWESGAFSGGTRVDDGRGIVTWTANASGLAAQAPIGSLSVIRSGPATCPMLTPTFSLNGVAAYNSFSIPLTLTYRHGALLNVNLIDAAFSGGESLEVMTSGGRRQSVSGVVTKGKSELAAFRTNMLGNGTLTIISSGAQYAIADWIVVGI